MTIAAATRSANTQTAAVLDELALLAAREGTVGSRAVEMDAPLEGHSSWLKVVTNLGFSALGLVGMAAVMSSLRQEDGGPLAVVLQTKARYRLNSLDSLEPEDGTVAQASAAERSEGAAADLGAAEAGGDNSCDAQPASEASPSEVQQPLLGVRDTLLMTSVSMAHGVMFSHTFAVVGVVESEWLKTSGVHNFLGNPNLTIGLVGLCAFASLAGPVVGSISDASRSQHGRRRPVLLVLTGMAWVMTFALSAASGMKSYPLYMTAFFFHQTSYFAHNAVFTGMMMDFSTPESASLLGGLKLLYLVLGVETGIEVAHRTRGAAPQVLGGLSALLTLVSTLLACWVCKEDISARWTEAPQESLMSSPFRKLFKGLADSTRHSFGKLALSRMCATASTAAVACSLWFVQDMFQRGADDSDSKSSLTIGMHLFRCGIGAIALGAGWTTARLIWKISKVHEPTEEQIEWEMRRRMNIGCLWMALLWFLVPQTWHGAQHDFDYWGCSEREVVEEKWSCYLILIACFWGIGQGVNLAAGEALSFKLIPRSPHYALVQGWAYTFLACGAVAGGAMTGAVMELYAGQIDAASLQLRDREDEMRWKTYTHEICGDASKMEGRFYREKGYEAVCWLASALLVLSIGVSWLMRLK
eukprot:CAMPEP_0178397560 /NCGR_PEP_ID=MMETSP0689_2-20121128/14311_1 /TAXON_ID=160604 /ORGANISM="Amphidinium massartii, Strain CS-259" /LENGTH=641 /DNA_ID=CAMNT_0020018277 /DNA_START=20 /DNA_END=1942 /DNA_ORIENTATION=+